MDKVPGISESNSVSANRNVRKTNSDLFKTTLGRALKDKEVEKTQKPGPSSLGEIPPPVRNTLASASPDLSLKAGQLLARLDTYAKDLKNPEKSLKDLEPTILTIKNDAAELLELADKSPQPDEELKNIVNAFAVTANVEFIKFKRGDLV